MVEYGGNIRKLSLGEDFCFVGVNNLYPIHTYRSTASLAILIPYFAEGESLEFFLDSEHLGKAGVLQFTRYCAAALARRNIRVNSITPGPFPNVTPSSNMEFIGRLSGKTMMKRTGKAEELSGGLLLLCSDASSFMTGTNIVVDGGMTAW